MKEVTATIFEKPKDKGSILVCGLPGSGLVGKIGADYLISTLNARKIAEYRCNSFPPQINVKENGIAETPKAELFYVKKEKGLFVFTADAQPSEPSEEYKLCESVIKLVKNLGVREVYSLAAYITGYFPIVPKVYGAATNKRLLLKLAENGVSTMSEGAITGMNGLIIGIASLYKLKAACLLGETSGYVLDASASQSVLEVFSKLTNITIDMTKMKTKAEETRKLVGQIQRLAEQEREQSRETSRERRPGYIS